MTFKYEQQILEAFAHLRFKPRDNQVEHIDLILRTFIDDKKKDIILSAPTGSGKSIIGVVVPEALNKILGNQTHLRSVIGMHQNILAEQYSNTFKGNDAVVQIKGAANYDCAVMDDTAENCIASSLYTMENGEELREMHCSRCKFDRLKKIRNSVNHLVTNYSFIFVDRMVANILKPRLCYVWDEAHLLSDTFTEHNAVFVSAKRLKDFLKDVSEYPIGLRFGPEIKQMTKDIEKNEIDDSNYIEFVIELKELYGQAKAYFEREMEDCIRRREIHGIKKLGKLSKKYTNLSCKIADLVAFNYPHVFDLNIDTHEFAIKPIFMGKMFDVIRNSEYNLFMSATLSEAFAKETMGLDAETTAYIKLPSAFPPENKNVLFVQPLLNLNYQSMQKKETVDTLKEAVRKIVKFHDDLGESGIVLAPSFVVAEMMAEELRKSKLKMTVFEHVRGEKGAVILQQFKAFHGQGVLISPSIFEGVDLPGDLSRFQIIVKTPWPSLGDKRTKMISTSYPKVYKAIALHKLIQGLGRSIRSAEDHATSYILDQHGYALLMDPMNIWADEFSGNIINISDI